MIIDMQLQSGRLECAAMQPRQGAKRDIKVERSAFSFGIPSCLDVRPRKQMAGISATYRIMSAHGLTQPSYNKVRHENGEIPKFTAMIGARRSVTCAQDWQPSIADLDAGIRDPF